MVSILERLDQLVHSFQEIADLQFHAVSRVLVVLNVEELAVLPDPETADALLDVLDPDVNGVDLRLELLEVALAQGLTGDQRHHIAVSELNFYFAAVLCLLNPHVLDQGDREDDGRLREARILNCIFIVHDFKALAAIFFVTVIRSKIFVLIACCGDIPRSQLWRSGFQRIRLLVKHDLDKIRDEPSLKFLVKLKR